MGSIMKYRACINECGIERLTVHATCRAAIEWVAWECNVGPVTAQACADHLGRHVQLDPHVERTAEIVEAAS